MARPSGLGRGLQALIPGDDEALVRELPIDSVVPNVRQPRDEPAAASLASLVASVEQLGVLQPVLVRPTGVTGRYELIAGERRWRAAQQAGLATVPALVRVADDVGSLEQALVENLHREDLTALEEAAAYQQLVDDFGMTQDAVAERVGKSRPTIANTLRLLQLPPEIQRLVADGALSAGHARALVGLEDRAFQVALATRAAGDGMSVREVEAAVRARDERRPDATRSRRSPTADRPAGLVQLEELLTEHLQTQVSVSLGGRKGKVVVHFADLEDLERIYRAMTPADG